MESAKKQARFTRAEIKEMAWTTLVREGAKQAESAEGIFDFIAEQTAFIAAVLADAPEDSVENALGRIANFGESEVDPDPGLTAAMVDYFRREAKHGRLEASSPPPSIS